MMSTEDDILGNNEEEDNVENRAKEEPDDDKYNTNNNKRKRLLRSEEKEKEKDKDKELTPELKDIEKEEVVMDDSSELTNLKEETKLKEEKEEEWNVKVGDQHNLFDILFSGTNTTVLIDRRMDEYTIQQLQDKFVLLYFLVLPRFGEPNLCHFKPQPELNFDLDVIFNLHRNEFEVVFVAIGENEDFFDEILSQIRWLAIPHDRREHRDYIKNLFGIPDKGSERAILFDKNGVVISANAGIEFTTFGVHAFPFTKERIGEFVDEIDELKNKLSKGKAEEIPCLTELLGQSVRSLSTCGEKVLTSELESKVVGLYFLAPTPDGIELTRKLLHVWNLLPDEKRDAFEIVIINKAPFNRRTVKALLEDKFGLTIPWYIIEVCGKKLSYIFERDYSGILTRQETYGEGDLIVHMEDKYQSPTYFTVNIKELTEGQIKDSLEMKIAGCFPLELKDNQFTNEAEEKEKEREKKEVTCEVDAKEKLKENEFILEAEENDVGKENEIEYEKRTSTKGLAEEKGLIEEVEEDGEYSEPEEPKQWTVNVGDEHKLLDLLFSGTDTDDLIDSRMRGHSMKQLNDKFVLLYFLVLPRYGATKLGYYEPHSRLCFESEVIYKLHRNEFEVVFVAIGENEDFFDIIFPRMCWLAIPHERRERRNHLKELFSIPDCLCERGILFDKKGVVISKNVEIELTIYGVHGFPFTREMIGEFVDKTDELKNRMFKDKAEEMPCLTELFGKHVRSLSKCGEKVLTSELETKTVALYFFTPTSSGIEWTKKILQVWNLLNNAERDAFKIVVINKAPFSICQTKAMLKDNFGLTIPWFIVEDCGKKLCHIFERDYADFREPRRTNGEGDFIVLKKDKFQRFSYFALNILLHYGKNAFPFTMETAVKLEKQKQQEQLLSDLLSPEAPLYRVNCSAFRKEDSVATTVSKLFGKRVFLLFATSTCFEFGQFLPELKQIYEKKGTDDDFEIVYISLDCNEMTSSFGNSIQGMPWLVHAFNQQFSLRLTIKLFGVYPPRLPALAAFDRDGRLVTKRSNLAFREELKSKYLLDQADMDEEVNEELICWHQWDLKSVISNLFLPRKLGGTPSTCA